MEDEATLADAQGMDDVGQEKTLTQSQVNEIVGRSKAQVAERIRKEMAEQHAAEIEQLKSNSQSPVMDESYLNKMLDERDKKREEEYLKRNAEAEDAEYRKHLEAAAGNYFQKVNAGKVQFDDFDEVMKDVDLSEFSAVALLAGDCEDPAAIMYELAKNPLKLAQLDLLTKKSGTMAQKEMAKLSQSIVQNRQALDSNQSTREPLSRLKPSNVGGDSGEMNLRDLKKAPWLRG